MELGDYLCVACAAKEGKETAPAPTIGRCSGSCRKRTGRRAVVSEADRAAAAAPPTAAPPLPLPARIDAAAAPPPGPGLPERQPLRFGARRTIQ